MYSVAIAGTTERTVLIAQALARHPAFKIEWVLTPTPKTVGRRQVLTPSPLAIFAKQQAIPIIMVDHKIDAKVRTQLNKAPIDFLIVVDFGYLVPSWLLAIPKIAPINIHPSRLPRWRGSSPGQFVLLNGETSSAVSIIVMNDRLDEGPVVASLPFTVNQDWNQTAYYQHAFHLVAGELPQILEQFALSPDRAIPQPTTSPTPMARQLNKEDGYITWDTVNAACQGQSLNHPNNSQLLSELAISTSWPILIERACRAFHPWPILWTTVITTKGSKRLKILTCHVTEQQLVLDNVQLEGQQPATWNQIKNSVK